MKKVRLDGLNFTFIVVAHLLAIGALVYLIAVRANPWTIGLGFLWFAFCGLAITGGYHRLFAHATYEATTPLKIFYLLFGAASVQNSALKWSSDHRIHHSDVDTERDPYDITQGFWWAHIGWVVYKSGKQLELNRVKDLARDPWVMLQHKYWIPLAILMAAVVPFCLGLIWGDPIGALLVAGFLRLIVQWHATFAINSVAHWIGSRPYSLENSARDSWITALITMGEGYHNFHHRFQADYRNGVRWFHFDPTKWFVWTMSHVKVTRKLRRAPREAIEKAKAVVREQKLQHSTVS